MTPSPSPQDQALAARLEFNSTVQNTAASHNAQNVAKYHEDVLQWIGEKNELQGRAELPPIPDPPHAWATRPKAGDAELDKYNALFPGLPPALEDYETADSVCPKYIDAAYPVAFGPVIGDAIGNNYYKSGYVVNGEIVNDQTPAGTRVIGVSRDGVHGTFEKIGTFVGAGWWLKIS